MVVSLPTFANLLRLLITPSRLRETSIHPRWAPRMGERLKTQIVIRTFKSEKKARSQKVKKKALRLLLLTKWNPMLVVLAVFAAHWRLRVSST